MKLFLIVFITAITFIGLTFGFGGKNLNDRSNGAKVTAAGLLALGLIAATLV